MLPKSWVASVGALVALMAVTGFIAVWGAPEGGRVTGIWPAGLATGCLLLARRRHTLTIVAAIFAVAFGTIWLGGRPVGVALGFSIGSAIEAFLVARIFYDGVAERPQLRSDRNLRHYFGAVVVGGFAAALLGFVTSAVADWGSPGLVAASIGSAHVASNLTLIPFFCRLPDQESVSTSNERLLQWGTILVITPLVFLPHSVPSAVYVVIPVLAWGALRLTPRQSLAQMVTVLAFAIIFTTRGRGPFADVPQRYDLPVDARGLLLAGFAITCAVIVIPLMIRVGEEIATTRVAAGERDLIQNIVDGATGIAIIGTDETGRVTLFNPGAEKLLGYTAEEMMGQPTTILHTAAAVSDKAAEVGVRDDFLEVVVSLARPSAAGSLLRFRRKDGVERTHMMTLNRLVDNRGSTTGYVSTSEDVTDQLDAQRALEDALETEREAVERLRQVDEVKDAFVSSVSHELRTPMTSILGYLEVLGDGSYGALNRRQYDAVRRVSDNTSRLLGLIDDLLTLSRVGGGGLDLIERVFDLRSSVSVAYDVLSPSWSNRALEVTISVPDEPVPLVGDRDMVERVVLNLLGNAVKFTPDGGLITVGLDVEGSQAVLSVRDSGIGIPEQEQPMLFTRFFRSTLAQKAAIPGSGLGLSITRAIIEKHGGTIEVESVAGEGTTFIVRLPIVV